MGWILITIVLPIIAPLIGILFLRPFQLLFPNGVPSMIVAVKDGQLGWAALGFCTSALYEIFVPGVGMKASTGQDYFWVIGGSILMMMASGMMAAIGSAFPTPYPRPANVSAWKHYSVLRNSIWITALSALLYAMVHYGMFGMQAV